MIHVSVAQPNFIRVAPIYQPGTQKWSVPGRQAEQRQINLILCCSHLNTDAPNGTAGPNLKGLTQPGLWCLSIITINRQFTQKNFTNHGLEEE